LAGFRVRLVVSSGVVRFVMSGVVMNTVRS